MSTTSFPFLKIAREHDLPYEKVIQIAQAIEDNAPISNWMMEANFYYKFELIYLAVEAEQERRRVNQS